MFKSCFSDPSLLKKIIESIKELINDASWSCDDNGISLNAMDSSHVALVSILLDKSSFTEYQCDKSITLGINTNSLSKILKCSSNDEIITIQTDYNCDVLKIIYNSKNRESEYELKLMNLDVEHVESLKDLNYECKDLINIGDTISINCTKDGVIFSTKGDSSNGNIKLDNSYIINGIQEDICETFSLKYMNFFTKASSLSDKVLLYISNEIPIMIEYELNYNSYIRFYLAPKLKE